MMFNRQYGLFLLALLMAAFAPAQEQTIDEWVDVYVQKEAADQISTNQTFKDIRFGAGLCLAEQSGKKTTIEGSLGFPEWQAKADAFKTFMTNAGSVILGKWLADESLSAEETEYLPVVQAAYLSHALTSHQNTDTRYFVLDLGTNSLADCTAYYAEVDNQGSTALEKGYLTGQLSAEDLESIRLKRIARNSNGVGGGLQLPNKLGIDGYDDFRAGDDMTEMVELLDTAYTLEAALQFPEYTDEADYEYYADVFLRPAGVLEWLVDISGFETQQVAGGQTVARAACPEITDPSQHLAVSDALGSRPLVLFFAGSDDVYVDDFFSAFQGLYEAYSNEADFVYINHTINDYLMTPVNFFRNAEHHHIGNAPTVEERARVSKNLCMLVPSVSFPFLMDHESDQFKSTFHQFSWNFLNLTTFVIDRNGELAAMWEEFFQVSLHANVVEQALQTLLRNDGLRDPDVEGTFVVNWQEMNEGEICAMAASYACPQADPERLRLFMNSCVIQSIQSNVVTVSATLPGGGAKLYTVQTTSFTRFLDGQETSFFDDLQVGDAVKIEFWADDYLGGDVTATTTETQMYFKRTALHTLTGNTGQLDAKRYPANYQKAKGVRYEVYADTNAGNITATEILTGTFANFDAWFYGRITGIDRTNREITVARNLADAQAMKGVRFWQEAGDAAASDTETQARLDILDDWIAHDELGEKQIHQFKLDDATWLTLNGEYVWDIDQFKVGDSVSANFYYPQADNVVILPDHFRVSRGAIAADTDGDGLPDHWEAAYYGEATNAVATNLCANGENTVLEAYIAGLDPTDSSAQFRLSNVQNALSWNMTSGRVYTVWWTSNLFGSFQPLESNFTGGAFTDLLHDAEGQGFYKLDAQLQ